MEHKDERLEKVEEITISKATFKKALKRDYLGDETIPTDHSRSYVLRLTPPFGSEMEAEYHESEQGRHYDDEWSEKPYHIKPQIIFETIPLQDRKWMEWPTYHSIRSEMTEAEIEECGGIEVVYDEHKELFWNEIEPAFPDSVMIGPPANRTEIAINWEE